MQRLQQYSHIIPIRSREMGKHDRNFIVERPVRLCHTFLDTINPAVLDFTLFFMFFTSIFSVLSLFVVFIFRYFFECIVHRGSLVEDRCYKCNEMVSFYLDMTYRSYIQCTEIPCCKYSTFE
jgi:hypothetical protein